MNAEKVINYLLSNDVTVSGLVADRIYPRQLPENPDLPAIVYTRVSGPLVQSLQGSSHLAHPRIQVDVFTDQYDEAKALAMAVKNALIGQRGTFAGVVTKGILFYGDQDMNDDLEENLVSEQHRVMMEFGVWHTE